MKPAHLYLRLAEGTGELAPDQRTLPRRLFALLCASLVLLATPLFMSATAFAGTNGDAPVAVRAGDDDDDRRSGSGSDDDDDDPNGTDKTGKDTDTAALQRQLTTKGAANDATQTTTSNRAGTTRTATTTGNAKAAGDKQLTTAGAGGKDDSGTTTSNRAGTTRTQTTTGK